MNASFRYYVNEFSENDIFGHSKKEGVLTTHFRWESAFFVDADLVLL